MGTPEFPDLGKHCSVDVCKLIDFLPFTCDRCNQIFCLEHRSYSTHQCPKGNRNDVTVVICPLCAKSVRLNPDEDANITWESHANTDCDPSNYDKVTKKKKCPVQGCRGVLTFSNTVKCRDCLLDHCLKHRFGPDHRCPGPKKPDTGFHFLGLLNQSNKKESSSSSWTRFKTSAEASMTKLSKDFTQMLNMGEDEKCPLCDAKFSSVAGLVDHAKKVHEKGGNLAKKVVLDVCPKCSKGFRDPVDLVKHVERDHTGTSNARKSLDLRSQGCAKTRLL